MENENQIFVLLGEIKGKMSGFMDSLEAASKRTSDHEARIRSLETARSKQSGVIAGITLAATTVATVIGFLIQHLTGH
jgi:hypothetical protein